MTVTMYDSTSPVQSIPHGSTLIAAYIDGRYGLLDPAVEAAFPGATFITIDATGANAAARVVDCEFGDLSPTAAAQWCHVKITGRGERPTIYCSTSLYAACAAALQALGLTFGRDVDWWEAHYDGVAQISNVPGAIGKQYQSDTAANLDTSIVLAAWVAGTHAPAPTPQPSAPPASQEATDMAAEDPISGGSWGVKSDGSVYAYDGAPYLGGLNNHPEWHTPAIGPAVGICPWKGNGTDANGNGYVIYVLTPTAFALYRFPRSGVYSK